MADDKNTNQDPEEEREDQFDDDEDFGLPDLEYEELDDDDDFDDEMDVPDVSETDDTSQEEVPEITPEEPVTEPSADTTETPLEETSAEVDAGDATAEDEINLEDIDLSDIDSDMSDEELQKEIEKMEAEGIDLSEGGEESEFYEEESFEEFDEKTDPLTSVFGADDSSESSPGTGATTYGGQPFEDKVVYGGDSGDKKSFYRIVIIGSLVIIIVAVLFLVYSDPEADAEEQRTERVEQVPVEEPEPVVDTTAVESTPVESEPIETTPAPASMMPAGEITQLESATGKSYIIISSFIDEDLAMDHAKKLAADGESPIIIPPFRDYRFYRVAVAEFESFTDANNNLLSYQDRFGGEVWALRYQ